MQAKKTFKGLGKNNVGDNVNLCVAVVVGMGSKELTFTKLQNCVHKYVRLSFIFYLIN